MGDSKEALDEVLVHQVNVQQAKRTREKYVDDVWKIVEPKLVHVQSYEAPNAKTPVAFQEFNAGKDVTALKTHFKYLLFNFIKSNYDEPPSVDACASEFILLCGDPAHGGQISWESIAEVQIAVSMLLFKIVAPPIMRHSAAVDFVAHAWQATPFFHDTVTAIKRVRNDPEPLVRDDLHAPLLIDVKCFPDATTVQQITAKLVKQASTVDVVAVCTDGCVSKNLEEALTKLDGETKSKVVVVTDATWSLRVLINKGLAQE